MCVAPISDALFGIAVWGVTHLRKSLLSGHHLLRLKGGCLLSESSLGRNQKSLRNQLTKRAKKQEPKEISPAHNLTLLLKILATETPGTSNVKRYLQWRPGKKRSIQIFQKNTKKHREIRRTSQLR